MKYNKDNWKGELEPFWPHDVIDKGLIACIVIGIFFAIAFFMPDLFLPPHEMPADSTNTPLAVKPEWYFLAAYQTLKLFPTKIFRGRCRADGDGRAGNSHHGSLPPAVSRQGQREEVEDAAHVPKGSHSRGNSIRRPDHLGPLILILHGRSNQ